MSEPNDKKPDFAKIHEAAQKLADLTSEKVRTESGMGLGWLTFYDKELRKIIALSGYFLEDPARATVAPKEKKIPPHINWSRIGELLQALDDYINADEFGDEDLRLKYHAYKHEQLPLDPNGFHCPSCGTERPPYGWHFNVGDTGPFALQWMTCFCGECRTILSVNVLAFLPKTELAEQLKKQFAGKIGLDA